MERHLYKLFVGREHTSLLATPVKYANPPTPVDSINIAHNKPIIALIIKDISRYLGVEHIFVVLQKISPKISTGNNINVAIFWVCKLLTPIK